MDKDALAKKMAALTPGFSGKHSSLISPPLTLRDPLIFLSPRVLSFRCRHRQRL